MPNRSQLIAHRGEMHRFAENTLPAIKAAIDAGARNVEIDIQLSPGIKSLSYNTILP